MSHETPPPAPTFTAEEVEAMVETRVQERLRGPIGARNQLAGARPVNQTPQQDGSTSAMLDKLIQLKIAEQLGQGTRLPEAPSGPPSSNRGAPPTPNSGNTLDDFARWPEADRSAYLKTHGLLAYRTALNGSLKGRSIKLR